MRPSGHLPTLIASFLHFDVSFMLWVLLGALGIAIAESTGLTPAEKGLVVAIPTLSGSLLRVPLGILGDRLGGRRVGIAMLAFLFLPLGIGWQAGGGLPVLVAVGLLLGVAGASFAVALPLASRWYGPEHQGLAMGVAAAGNSGTVMANLAAPQLANLVGWHNVLALAMVPLALVLIAFALLAKDSPSRPQGQWAEKEGVTTSSERRVSYMAALVPPPGAARADWQIFAELGRRLGYGAHFAYDDAETIYDEYRRCTIGTGVDIGGVSYDRLRVRSRQWPLPHDAADADGTARLYTDLRFPTADGRAHFGLPVWRAGEPAGAPGQLTLTTGREKDQWHTMTRTANVPQLLKSCPEPYLAVHPDDAATLELADGDWVEVAQPGRGRARFQARLCTELRPGTVYAPFHWGALRHAGGSINEATSAALDPLSKQPALKLSRVHVRRLVDQ